MLSHSTAIAHATQDGMAIISYLKYWEYKGRTNYKVLDVAKKMGIISFWRPTSLTKESIRILASDMVQLSEQFVKSAHAVKAKVFIDEKKGNPTEWEKIIQWGTDGIQTDDPAALINFLNNRK